jgi:hypothetical protein
MVICCCNPCCIRGHADAHEGKSRSWPAAHGRSITALHAACDGIMIHMWARGVYSSLLTMRKELSSSEAAGR